MGSCFCSGPRDTQGRTTGLRPRIVPGLSWPGRPSCDQPPRPRGEPNPVRPRYRSVGTWDMFFSWIHKVAIQCDQDMAPASTLRTLLAMLSTPAICSRTKRGNKTAKESKKSKKSKTEKKPKKKRKRKGKKNVSSSSSDDERTKGKKGASDAAFEARAGLVRRLG
jgi:hypothetical protein